MKAALAELILALNGESSCSAIFILTDFCDAIPSKSSSSNKSHYKIRLPFYKLLCEIS